MWAPAMLQSAYLSVSLCFAHFIDLILSVRRVPGPVRETEGPLDSQECSFAKSVVVEISYFVDLPLRSDFGCSDKRFQT